MTAEDWVKLRLPNGASFIKNGVELSVDDAVTAALALYSGNVPDAAKRYALADLLEVMASDVLADRERQGDYDSGVSNLRQKIADLREEAAAIEAGDTGGESGGIRIVDATFRRLCADENSSCR